MNPGWRPAPRAVSNDDDDVILAVSRLWTVGPVVGHRGGDGAFHWHEQMPLFAAAAALIGQHGAGLEGAVAMRPGAAVAEMLPEEGTNSLNMVFTTLAHALGLPGAHLL